MSRGQPNAYQVKRLFRLEEELKTAGHGHKVALVQECAIDLGQSAKTVYRWLRNTRIRVPQRKRRADAGLSSMPREYLELIAADLITTGRKNGKLLGTPGQSLEFFKANGLIPGHVSISESQLRKLLLGHGLSPAQLARPTPSQRQRSLHPNHVWQVDASVCVAYYLSNATGLQVMDEDKFYKNKPNNLTRIQQERLIRYVVADHYSHALKVRYYLGSESAKNLADFLIYCFSKTEGPILHGVPFMLEMDMGAANTSKSALNMLDQLQVRYRVHERGNSRANGSVEVGHNIVERRFESQLKRSHVADLDDLNAKAQIWAARYCSEMTHGRYGATRSLKWMEIKPEELRLAPPEEVMRALPTSLPKERRVDNDLWISYSIPGFGQRHYDLRFLPGVMAGRKVTVRLNALQIPAIQVMYLAEDGEERWLTVNPIERDAASGFLVGAPIKGEEMRRGPRTVVDDNRDGLLMAAYGGASAKEAEERKEKGVLPFAGKLDAFKADAEAKLPFYLPRSGTPLVVEGHSAEPPRVTTVAACKQVLNALRRNGLGDAYGPHIRAEIMERWPSGVPEDELDAYMAELCGNAPGSAAGAAQQRAAGGL